MSLTNAQMQQLHWQAKRLKELHRGRKWNSPQERVIQAIFKDGYKRIFIRKGRKGGGTETILYPAIRIAGMFPNRSCYIIGPQYNLQKEIIWNNNRLRQSIPASWKPDWKNFEARVVIPHQEGSSFIKVHGADNWKSMVGIEGDLFVFDELADHDIRAYKNCYPNVQSRDAIWIVVGAPPVNRVKSSFYYKLEQQIRDDPSWFFIHWTTWDNAEFLPGGVEGIQKEKEAYYARGEWDEWECRYEARYIVGGRGTVLTHFRPEGDEGSQVLPHDVVMAEIERDRKHLRWYQIYDPGFSTCFCVMFAAYNPYASRMYLLDEIYETDRDKLSVDSLWPRIIHKQQQLYPEGRGKWRRVYDSAAPGFPQEVRSRWKGHPGLDPVTPFIPTHKEKGDEDKYFRIWNSALYNNQCIISERCRHGSDEMENYATDEHGNYPDEDNHWLDNGRYLLKASKFKPTEISLPIRLMTDRPRVRTLEEELGEDSGGDPVMEMMQGGREPNYLEEVYEQFADPFGEFDDGFLQ